MPHGITQCYLPPGRGDIPALTPAEAGTRLSDPGGMQGWVDLVGRLPLLSTRPAVAPATLKKAATNFAAWWTEAQWVWTVCLRLLPDSVTAAIWTRAYRPIGAGATAPVSERQRTTVSIGSLHPGLQCWHAAASAFRRPSSTCTCRTAFRVQHLRPSGVVSCWPDAAHDHS